MMQGQREPVGCPGRVHSGRCHTARKVDSMSIELWRSTRPAINPLSQVLDRLFEQSFAPFTAGLADGGSTGFQSLPVNVWETEDGYHAALMAPGLDEETLELTV